jgi:acetyl esterase/lipase
MVQTPDRRTVRLAYGPEDMQFGELHLPGNTDIFPTVILIHGGFWRAPYGYSLMTNLAEDLANRGIAAWNIEYRRVGDTDGGWPSTLLDVAMAADYLRTIASGYSLDLQRVVSIGHSAGGHLALWLAARPRIPQDSILAGSSLPGDTNEKGNARLPLSLLGAVSQAGVADLEMAWRLKLGSGAAEELLGGSFNDFPERYHIASPAALLPLGIPQVLIHGTEDDRVPFVMSKVYAQAARAAGDQVALIELQGADHFVLINSYSEAWSMTVEALRKLLHLE